MEGYGAAGRTSDVRAFFRYHGHMAIARLLDVRHGDGIITSPNLNQEIYVNWVRFLRHCETNGLCTVVASQWNNGGAGEGAPFHDQANPLGENAFTYAEFDVGVARFGILVQWADASSFGASPGNPGLLYGSSSLDGVGIAMAFREDGTSPWAGTTGDTGTNTKGATVWTPGGSTVHVFPRSNNPGPPVGSHNTNKENMCRAAPDDVIGFSRAHWVANEDGIFHKLSSADDGRYVAHYVGRYAPRSGLTLPYPYCQIYRDNILFWLTGASNPYGGASGNSNENGGIIGASADGVMDLALSYAGGGNFDITYQPNNLISPVEFEGSPISVFQRESVGGTLGLAGFLPTELVAAFYNTSNHNTNAAADRAYIGDSTVATVKWGIPWDGGAVPGTNNTRTGRLSFTP